MAWVSKRFSFEAAHHLPNHPRQCKNLHGHHYEVEVTLVGSIVKDHSRPDDGMVFDFGTLSSVVRTFIVSRYDHTDLNETMELTPPTAENLALEIFRTLYLWIGREVAPFLAVRLYSVKVWETPDSHTEVTMADYKEQFSE